MNEVHLSGQVKRTWTYSHNLYARLSLRRSGQRPRRSPDQGGNYDYVTVCFPDGGRQGLSLTSGQQLTVHGWLQSRDFAERLADFLKRADGEDASASDLAANADLTVHRSVTEIVAERWSIQRTEVRDQKSEGNRITHASQSSSFRPPTSDLRLPTPDLRLPTSDP